MLVHCAVLDRQVTRRQRQGVASNHVHPRAADGMHAALTNGRVTSTNKRDAQRTMSSDGQILNRQIGCPIGEDARSETVGHCQLSKREAASTAHIHHRRVASKREDRAGCVRMQWPRGG